MNNELNRIIRISIMIVAIILMCFRMFILITNTFRDIDFIFFIVIMILLVLFLVLSFTGEDE